MMTTAISVRIPKELADQLDNIARETERPRSFIIQKALESYVEDFADLQVALDRLHDSTDAVVSGKELMAVQSDQLVIHSARHAREGWAKRFAAMAAKHDDRLLKAVFSPRRAMRQPHGERLEE